MSLRKHGCVHRKVFRVPGALLAMKFWRIRMPRALALIVEADGGRDVVPAWTMKASRLPRPSYKPVKM